MQIVLLEVKITFFRFDLIDFGSTYTDHRILPADFVIKVLKGKIAILLSTKFFQVKIFDFRDRFTFSRLYNLCSSPD